MSTTGLSVAEIAEAVGHANGKQIRAYLRKAFARDLELKNSRWGNAKDGYKLSAKMTEAAIARFTPADEEEAS